MTRSSEELSRLLEPFEPLFVLWGRQAQSFSGGPRLDCAGESLRQIRIYRFLGVLQGIARLVRQTSGKIHRLIHQLVRRNHSRSQPDVHCNLRRYPAASEEVFTDSQRITE